MRRAGTHLLLAAAIGWIAPGVLVADDEGAVRVLRARALAHERECGRAANILEQKGVPATGEAWLEVGKCYIARSEFAAAPAPLDRALELDPGLAPAYLYLGIAHYHAGDTAGARAALDRAREAGVSAAQLDLYAGVLQLDDGQDEKAASSFARARARDPGAVEPLASYFEGVARERTQDYDGAASAFRRASAGPPGSPWSQSAHRGLDRVRGGGNPRQWAEASAGIEYNTDVVLRGSGVQLPSNISNESDHGGVWTAEAGLELVRERNWRGGGLVYYYGSHYDDLDDFNVQAPNGGLYVDFDFSEKAMGRLRYDYGYAWLGSDSFLSSHNVSGVLFRDWDDSHTRFLSRLFSYDYKYTVPVTPLVAGVNTRNVRERDGNGVELGFEHSLPLGVADAELFGGYRYQRYWARGDDYSYQGHAWNLGSEVPLPFEVLLDLEGTYGYVPYLDPSSYPQPGSGLLENANRRDSIFAFSVGLERQLMDNIDVAVRYDTLDHDSNVDVFDYHQQVVGLYFTVRTER